MDQALSQQATDFVKRNKALILSTFCNIEKFPPSLKPFTMFMAGSPGAGKTEFSISIIPELQKRDPESKIVRIDADEIRSIIPQYNGHNSDEVQSAAILGLEKVFDYVHHHSQNCILDGTFQNYSVSCDNVKRALGKNRSVGIFYIYQNPLVAWTYTKRREKIDHRFVPKDAFIKAFFNSKDNVLRVKSEFGDKVELNVIVQDESNHVKDIDFNTSTIDKSLHSGYTIGSLQAMLDDRV